MRLTISGKANQRFIKDLARRWEMSETEAINYLLNQCRLNGFSNTFHNKDYDTSSLPEIQPPLSFYEELAKEEFTPAIDPVIERMAGLIEEF